MCSESPFCEFWPHFFKHGIIFQGNLTLKFKIIIVCYRAIFQDVKMVNSKFTPPTIGVHRWIISNVHIFQYLWKECLHNNHLWTENIFDSFRNWQSIQITTFYSHIAHRSKLKMHIFSHFWFSLLKTCKSTTKNHRNWEIPKNLHFLANFPQKRFSVPYFCITARVKGL